MARGFRRHAAIGVALVLSCLSLPSQAQIPAPAEADVRTCITGDSLLDSPAMRELLRLLWDHSNADRPADERRERAGCLFDSSGVLVHRADLHNPRNTPCRSFVSVPLSGKAVAVVSTHPFRPGDVLPAACHPHDPAVRQYTVERFGGASELDLTALLDWRVPGYILDKEYIYAIPRGATKENALSVVKRFPRVDRTTGCRIL